MKIIMMVELFSAILSDLERGKSPADISAIFHSTLAQMVTQMCQLIAKETHIATVALSGGVFQNRLLLRMAKARLEQAGFNVLTHSQAPCNDGGISLGQAVIANLHFP
jgi:hydrogenase maturation protein HypF